MLKNQLVETKKQLEALTPAQQDAGCQQGLTAMKQLNAAMGIK